LAADRRFSLVLGRTRKSWEKPDPEDAGGFREETHSVLRVLFVINA
jgi:hypothetical protein